MLKLPKLCKDRNQAFSKYRGKRYYHGVWGSPEAEKSYKRFIATLLENPVMLQQPGKNADVPASDVLVSELAACYFDTIEKSRMHKSHVSHFKQVIGYLVDVYGELSVNDFSPKKLKAVRKQMVNAGTLCRNTINDYTNRIIRIFAWGVEEELAKTDVNVLREVKALPKGEPGTFDHEEREPVPECVIAATLPFLPPTVAAMVIIQWLTGMRPNEVFNMRVGDIDRTRGNGLWYYVPGSYKTIFA
jgi:hypothetical protein